MGSLKDFTIQLKRKPCPNCGSMCADDAETCWSCGYTFTHDESKYKWKVCKECLSPNEMNAEVCWQCGCNSFVIIDDMEDTSLGEEMWLREKEIAPIGEDIYLQSVVTAGDIWCNIEEELNTHKLPHETIRAWITSGGILNHRDIPCFVVSHPEHRYDWFGFCVVRRAMGDTACVSIYICGDSEQMKKEAYLQNARAFDGHAIGNAALGALRGGAAGAGYAVGSLIGGAVSGGAKAIKKGISRLTMDYGALEEEKLWYDLVIASFREVFFGGEA